MQPSSEKVEEAHVEPLDVDAPIPAAVVGVTDEVPDGGYGWVCVFAVGQVLSYSIIIVLG